MLTLVLIEFQQYDLTKYAFEQTLEHCNPDEVLVVSDKDFIPGSRFVYRDPVVNYREYNKVMLKEVASHINQGHSLFAQWDGIAHNKDMWTDDFLKYDYIGAPWFWRPEGYNVGNGGFSLRSKKLLDSLLDDRFQLADGDGFTEDSVIGFRGRPLLEREFDIKFPTAEAASQFSFEHGRYSNSFGFHGAWNIINMMSDKDIDYIVPKMNFNNWPLNKCQYVLTACIRRHRKDMYDIVYEKLSAYQSNLPDWVDNAKLPMEVW